jgi:hypothetical protein
MVETRLQSKRGSPSGSETPANKRQKRNEPATPPITPEKPPNGKRKTIIKVKGQYSPERKLKTITAVAPPPPPPALSETYLKRARKWEVFLGREIKDDPTGEGVTDEDMDDFLANEITARFPQGSTYSNVTGQWGRSLADGDGTDIAKEVTVIIFLMAFEGDDPNALAEFRRKVFEAATAYRDRFRQDAVLVCESENMTNFI